MECLRISSTHICVKYRQTKLRGSESPTTVLPAATLETGSQNYSILILALTEQMCGCRFFLLLLSPPPPPIFLIYCFVFPTCSYWKERIRMDCFGVEMRWTEDNTHFVIFSFVFCLILCLCFFVCFFLMRKEEKLCNNKHEEAVRVGTRWYKTYFCQTESTWISQ